MTDHPTDQFVGLAADVVSSYVSKNSISAHDLPELIKTVHTAFRNAAAGQNEAEPAPLVPSVPIKKSVTPDYIISLEDGKKFKSLKRHLRTKYDMSPDEYRAKWGLSKDYPMVAPNYASARSNLARQMGLGRKPGERTEAQAPAAANAPAPAEAASASPPAKASGRGRRRAA